MQRLTADPRGHLTDDQVRELLTGQGVKRGHGCELLDDTNRVVREVNCLPWTVNHDNLAEVHGDLSITLTEEFAWGRDRFRPFLRLSKGAISARFYAGVYVLATPRNVQGRTPRVWQCGGRDLTHLLERQVGETHVIDPGAAGPTPGITYFAALRAALDAAGLAGVPLRLDGTRQNTPLPSVRVWALSDARWLDVVNDLLAEIAYTDIYTEHDGAYAARPLTPVEQRATEWTFDTRPTAEARNADLVAAEWAEERDLWAGHNSWRFVRDGLPHQPWLDPESTAVTNGIETTTGDGLYLVRNLSNGPSAISTVGERPAPVEVLQVADQPALVDEGDRFVAAARRVEHRVEMKVDPLPIAAHRDVVRFIGAGHDLKTMVSRWSLSPYEKSPWVLGGGPGGRTRERREAQVTGTVTSSSPLRVIVDGATVDSPANALADDSGAVPTYSANSRVRVTVRTPQVPIVQGIEQ